MDRHKPVSPAALAATRALIAEWAGALPAPEVGADLSSINARMRWQLVKNQLPNWAAANYAGTPPIGLAPLLAGHAGISPAMARKVLAGERAFSVDAEWARKLFS